MYDKDQVVHLNQLVEKYYGQGLRVVAISLDEPAELRKKVVEELGAKYWIGCGDTILTIVRFLNIRGKTTEFQMSKRYLVDVEGRVVDFAEALEPKIEELLQGYFDPALKEDLHPKLASARRHFEKGAVGRAWSGAKKKESDEDPAIAGDATYLIGHCEAYARWMRWSLDSLLKKRDYPAICKRLREVERGFAPMEIAGWAKTRLRELNADKGVRLELTAWAQLEKVIEKERKAKGRPNKLDAVREQYGAIIQKFPGTRAAAEARLRLRK
jgi:hypothetical protein